MKKFNKIGMTIIELIVVFAVAAIVLTPFSMLIASSLRSSELIQDTIESDQDVQQILIIYNEALRANGLNDDVEVITDYHSNGQALRIGNNVFFLKSSEYIMQTYDAASEQVATTNVLSESIIEAELDLTSVRLEVILHSDRNRDGVRDNEFPFVYSIRE
jgi:type II secretory pathway pseudopilin PulG